MLASIAMDDTTEPLEKMKTQPTLLQQNLATVVGKGPGEMTDTIEQKYIKKMTRGQKIREKQVKQLRKVTNT